MFGLIHGITFLFSALLWLLLAAWNTRAAALGMGAVSIGILNASAYGVYVVSALGLGHLGDKLGYKRPLAMAMILFAPALATGFAWRHTGALYATACLTCLFYGFFYPSVEGLLSRMEAREGADPVFTTRRFCLSWSSGNIFGMLLGPGLIQYRPSWIFLGGMGLCLGGAVALWANSRRLGDRLPGRYPAAERAPFPAGDLPLLLSRRLAARVALLLASISFFGIMFLFPKILWSQGIPPGRIGALAACGNLAVFILFASFGRTRFWIGRAGLTAALSASSLALFGFGILLFPASAWGFGILAALGGIAYAIPYTFAIYFGLNTPSADHSKQGAIHEMLIGIGLGGGPLLAGFLISSLGEWRVLGWVAIVFSALSLSVQVAVSRRSRSQSERVKL